MPAGAMLFDNGFYTLTNKNKTTLYDTDGNELFTVGKKDHKPVKCEGEYFLAEKAAMLKTSMFILIKQELPFQAHSLLNPTLTVTIR